MLSKFSSIALMGNLSEARVVESIRLLATHLQTRDVQLLLADDTGLDGIAEVSERVAPGELTGRAELIIAIGGDGSMLHAARAGATAGIPLLGINRGRLGFLADVHPSEHLESLDRLLAGDYVSENRMLLKAEIFGSGEPIDCGLALNDVVIKRQDTGRMLEFQSTVDGRFVNTHGGDGFIVATPTGSTAYALSCGGPIVAPGLDAIVLAPICPHTLSDRPIVIPATSMTEINIVDDPVDSAQVSCDGEVAGEITAGDRLRVAAAEQRVELIHPSEYDYYEILRSKLNWGRGNRNPLASD